MLIDWLTLRHPLTPALGETLLEKIHSAMGRMTHVSPHGEVLWTKQVLDWDEIRSDSSGMYWNMTGDGEQYFLNIGASPSSLENEGINVFGSLDLAHCSTVLVKAASAALGAILPHWKEWDCRRMDVTANYDMGSASQVKQALRLLLCTDAPRRKTASDNSGGDSVYWNGKSDLRSGKAYHKGAHLRFQMKKGNIVCTQDQITLGDRLIRLEMKLGARWFRRLETDWRELTAEQLTAEHNQFFSSLIGGGDVEVSDMGILLQELEKVCPTRGRALAAHRTFALIKTVGYTQTKESVPDSTFRLHCKYLRAAGLSSADLCAGKVIEFRRKSLVLDQPVLSWDEIRRAA
jgi:hypothetical protein